MREEIPCTSSIPLLHYSITPLLHYSNLPGGQTGFPEVTLNI